jgi:hypothetical protein
MIDLGWKRGEIRDVYIRNSYKHNSIKVIDGIVAV